MSDAFLTTRRDALVILAGAAALPTQAAPPKFFMESELAQLAKLVDVILPRTDTPGAADAQVHVILDERCGANAALGARWRELLGRLSGDAEAAVKAAVDTPDFKLLKDSTIDIYYATREGLRQELGWNANTYLPEWKGCTHDEHR